LPCGVTKDGLPIGLQLVGRPHGDADLIGMARFLEEALAFKPLVLAA
jgi:amidase